MPLPPNVKICCASIIVFLLHSCVGLKPTQIEAVEKYTSVTKKVAALPPEIYNRVYQLRSQTQTLQLSGVIATNELASESIDALQLDINDKIKFLNMVDSFAFAYRIVIKYADLVSCLVNKSYLIEFTKNKAAWQSSFDGLVTTYNTASAKRIPAATNIPPSVGSIVANVIAELGSAKIKYLQKKYLLAAITTARKPFEGICEDFLNTDIPKIQKELAQLPVFINENFKDFLNNLKAYETKQGNSPYNYYKLYLPIYLNWQVQLTELTSLVNQLKISISSLRNSYGVLEDYLSNTTPNNQMPAAITQLELDYFSLQNTLDKFSEARDRLYKITY